MNGHTGAPSQQPIVPRAHSWMESVVKTEARPKLEQDAGFSRGVLGLRWLVLEGSSSTAGRGSRARIEWMSRIRGCMASKCRESVE